jgi:hypothetical protein
MISVINYPFVLSVNMLNAIMLGVFMQIVVARAKVIAYAASYSKICLTQTPSFARLQHLSLL